MSGCNATLETFCDKNPKMSFVAISENISYGQLEELCRQVRGRVSDRNEVMEMIQSGDFLSKLTELVEISR